MPDHKDLVCKLVNVPSTYGRVQVMTLLHRAGPGRVAFYGIENPAGTPVYVHAEVTIIADEWCTVGSDNLDLRSWTYDSEISCAVLDQSGAADCVARRLRLALFREHLDRADDAGLPDPATAFAAFARSAARLQAWHDGGRRRTRPPGRPRP